MVVDGGGYSCCWKCNFLFCKIYFFLKLGLIVHFLEKLKQSLISALKEKELAEERCHKAQQDLLNKQSEVAYLQRDRLQVHRDTEDLKLKHEVSIWLQTHTFLNNRANISNLLNTLSEVPNLQYDRLWVHWRHT